MSFSGTLQMLTLRNLNLLDRPVPDGHIQSWMWHGLTIQEAIQSAMPDSKFWPFFSPEHLFLLPPN